MHTKDEPDSGAALSSTCPYHATKVVLHFPDFLILSYSLGVGNSVGSAIYRKKKRPRNLRNLLIILERAMGLEPTTSSLGS